MLSALIILDVSKNKFFIVKKSIKKDKGEDV